MIDRGVVTVRGALRWLACWCALMAVWWVGAVWAQPLTGATGATGAGSTVVAAGVPAVAPIAAGAILERAEQDQRKMDRATRRVAPASDIAALTATLDALTQAVADKQKAYPGERLLRLPVMRLESLDRHWMLDAERLDRWRADVRRVLGPFARDATQLAQLRAQWLATTESSRAGVLPPVLLFRAEAMVSALEEAERALAPSIDREIAWERAASDVEARIQAGRQDVADAIAEVDRKLFHLDEPPLWRPSTQAEPADAPPIDRGVEIEARYAVAYLAAMPAVQVFTVLAQLLLLPLVWWASHPRRVARGSGAASVAGGSTDTGAQRVARLPWSAWMVLSMALALALKWDDPILVRELAMLVVLVPLLRLVLQGSLRALGPWPWAALLFYGLNWCIVLGVDSGMAYRLLQMALALAAMVLVVWRLRWEDARALRGAAAELARLSEPLRACAWCAVALLGVGVMAAVVGNITLAEMLTSGVFFAAYLAVLLHESDALVRQLGRLVSERIQQSRWHALHASSMALVPLAVRALHGAAVLAWLIYVANAFRVLRPVHAWLVEIVSYRLEVGEIAVSVGGILVFMVSVVVAYVSAAVVRSVLRTRLRDQGSLPRGAGNSIASLSYYAILMLGFVLALSAAGFQVSQFALVFGALGVGIGFGLQNLVGNFISGVVLMFERPIQPGDVVEVGAVNGHVREIGLRATVLRTFDGADVIVPNGALLASNLVNWTLYDRSRRIEIQVGVPYDSDPAAVLQLLEGAARSVPTVVAKPAPMALLVGYGDSSLDFVVRVWTMDFENWQAVRSDVLAAALQALTGAGIEIPFNQLDVNLRQPVAATHQESDGAVHGAPSKPTLP
jgi:small-conductance mechanosensitive channel